MSEKITNIAKNTSYLTLALILQKIISFSYFIILARALGPNDLGIYYFAISFTTIIGIFIDLGQTNVLTREVARDQKNSEKLLGTIISIKIPLTIITFLFFLLLINILGYDGMKKSLIFLSFICVILDSFTSTFFAITRGHHNLFFESIGSVIFQLIVLIFGITMVYLGMDLRWIMGSLTLASLFNFSYSLTLLTKKWKIQLKPNLNKELIIYILKITIPFAIFAIFQRFYIYLDSVLLSELAGDKYVGLYQVAFKIIFALQFLPAAFIASLYPAMSAYWSSNREQLVITFERAMSYLIIISLPIAVGIATIADKVVLLFKSGYNEAILPLQINMVGLFFMFIAYPVGSLLNACDKQKNNSINMVVVTIVSVFLNILLIPKMQVVGVSITVAITNFLMFALGIYWVPKIINFKPQKLISIFAKSIIAAILMSAIAFYTKLFLNIFISIAISGIFYFLFLFILGAFKKEDIISIWQSFSKNKNNPIE